MGEKRRVLVVEDDTLLRSLVCEALQDAHYDVRTAANGREALAVLGKWRAHAIVLDLMMPVMDGRTFADELRSSARLRRIPVVVLSAAWEAGVRAREMGAAELVAKPFGIDELVDAVDRATGRLTLE
jgi:CheY-like chemotaxis protein